MSSTTFDRQTVAAPDVNVDERLFFEVMADRLHDRNLGEIDFQTLESYFRNQIWHNTFALRNSIQGILRVQAMKDYYHDEAHYHEIWGYVVALNRDLDMSPSLESQFTPVLLQREYDFSINCLLRRLARLPQL